MSGNSAYLLYKINLPNTDENKELVKKCLQVLDIWFSSEFVDIDCSVFNSARIAKIIGTIARKGSNTEDRPHRLSKILSTPQEIKCNEQAILLQLAAGTFPKKKNQLIQMIMVEVNLIWIISLSIHGIQIHKEQSTKDGKKVSIRECPFCGHKSPDSAIFKNKRRIRVPKCFPQ